MHINRLAEGNMTHAVPQSCNWLQRSRYVSAALQCVIPPSAHSEMLIFAVPQIFQLGWCYAPEILGLTTISYANENRGPGGSL